MGDLGNGWSEPCPHCAALIEFDAYAEPSVFHKPVPCPHCGGMVTLEMDEVEDERTQDWDWVYWFEKA